MFAVGLWIALVLSYFANDAVFPFPPVVYDPDFEGYHRAIIPASVFALICIGWLRVKIHSGVRWYSCHFRYR
jgi:hypothetical protein